MSSDTTLYPSLRDKTVVITGGATGIGAALVTAFAEQGARVAFLDIDEHAGDALATSLADSGAPGVIFRAADVSDAAQLTNALGQCQDALGAAHVLINNVANDTRHTPQELTPDRWRANLAVNLDAAFLTAQFVQPGMAARGGGAIINMSSINALLGPANMPGYVTAKAGLIGLTKALARDFGGDAIRVNAISPGWIVTERQLELWLTPEAEAAWMQQVALKTRIYPSDVAKLALFLASDDAAMITGQNLVIDGGRT